MKYGTAFKQAKVGVKFGIVTVPLVLAFWYYWARTWQFLAIAIAIAVYTVLDALVIYGIRRDLKKDPDLLKKRMRGT